MKAKTVCAGLRVTQANFSMITKKIEWFYRQFRAKGLDLDFYIPSLSSKQETCNRRSITITCTCITRSRLYKGIALLVQNMLTLWVQSLKTGHPDLLARNPAPTSCLALERRCRVLCSNPSTSRLDQWRRQRPVVTGKQDTAECRPHK
jgi:hypothetical protein